MTFSIDLWNLTFPTPGDYSLRVMVNGSEQRRLALAVLAMPDPAGPPLERALPDRRYDA